MNSRSIPRPPGSVPRTPGSNSRTPGSSRISTNESKVARRPGAGSSSSASPSQQQSYPSGRAVSGSNVVRSANPGGSQRLGGRTSRAGLVSSTGIPEAGGASAAAAQEEGDASAAAAQQAGSASETASAFGSNASASDVGTGPGSRRLGNEGSRASSTGGASEKQGKGVLALPVTVEATVCCCNHSCRALTRQSDP